LGLSRGYLKERRVGLRRRRDREEW
jgi:hypothetical protein